MYASVVVLLATLRAASRLLYLFLAALQLSAEQLGGDVRKAWTNIAVSMCSSYKLVRIV